MTPSSHGGAIAVAPMSGKIKLWSRDGVGTDHDQNSIDVPFSSKAVEAVISQSSCQRKEHANEGKEKC